MLAVDVAYHHTPIPQKCLRYSFGVVVCALGALRRDGKQIDAHGFGKHRIDQKRAVTTIGIALEA